LVYESGLRRSRRPFHFRLFHHTILLFNDRAAFRCCMWRAAHFLHGGGLGCCFGE
jgi:hypothetical protein